MTQKEMVIDHIKTYGFITPLEAMQEYGIYRLAARINELKASGLNIKTSTISSKNRHGKTVTFASYSLS